MQIGTCPTDPNRYNGTSRTATQFMTDSSDKPAVRRRLDTDNPEPAMAVVEALADIEGKDVTDYTPTYDCLDHVLDGIFSNPPAPSAAIRIEFSYEGYRITVEQDGSAEFVSVA